MYTLGIETSCDETSAAVVKDGSAVFSCEISSSAEFHKKYGGVIPEIASRMQLETITQVVDESLKNARVELKDIGLIGVTKHPGLLGSLLVGLSFAKAVSYSLNIPLIGINHLEAHIYSGFLNKKRSVSPTGFVALIVSGGHTNLFYIDDFDKIELLGRTRDDACGEAFDKVAKILGLRYPGGPIIEKIAQKGNPGKIKFKCSGTNSPLDFSFSGIKTAVLYYAKRRIKGEISDIAASFQEAVIDTLIDKSLLACKIKKTNKLVVGGGVAANSRLREKLSDAAKINDLRVFFPDKKFCMDNAAMVAGLGYRLFKKGHGSDLTLDSRDEDNF